MIKTIVLAAVTLTAVNSFAATRCGTLRKATCETSTCDAPFVLSIGTETLDVEPISTQAREFLASLPQVAPGEYCVDGAIRKGKIEAVDISRAMSEDSN